ncbi:phage tail assembly chaperone G [Streptococcus suis]|uniref:phage tail assembly chaperone G n=1 Tax=Streptococcus suis TaxID=1307 RepID=UPI0002B78733|nr:hypothetical protein [Streptococcus suis]AGF87364.1 hypothetical protein phi30c_0020 [Streptococcus phage phi30c]QBX20941.1 hypothetical protein Javan549_0014 [Streptococcus phage Javan549]WNF72428.1 hypothetical protein RJW53_04045 [Streptococcus suis]HEL1562042.1 hypothetical protein [Streptococcus suis]HEL1663750.1 hypothetical protein [Streptococcus suis]
MYEITLKQGGVDKVFKKDYVNVEDNLLAVEHQVRQAALYSNEKASLDPKKHRVLNEAYLQMFVDMYGKQFTVEDLKQADISTLEVLNILYLDALGGKNEETEGEEPKEA